MSNLAQGFVEVSSYVASIEAADTMIKAADVVIKRVHKVDGPIVCIICEGDVAACQAAVDAAASLCSARGTLLATNIIARPESDQLYGMLDGINEKKAARKKAKLEAQQAALAKAAKQGCGCNDSASDNAASTQARSGASKPVSQPGKAKKK